MDEPVVVKCGDHLRVRLQFLGIESHQRPSFIVSNGQTEELIAVTIGNIGDRFDVTGGFEQRHLSIDSGNTGAAQSTVVDRIADKTELFTVGRPVSHQEPTSLIVAQVREFPPLLFLEIGDEEPSDVFAVVEDSPLISNLITIGRKLRIQVGEIGARRFGDRPVLLLQRRPLDADVIRVWRIRRYVGDIGLLDVTSAITAGNQQTGTKRDATDHQISRRASQNHQSPPKLWQRASSAEIRRVLHFRNCSLNDGLDTITPWNHNPLPDLLLDFRSPLFYLPNAMMNDLNERLLDAYGEFDELDVDTDELRRAVADADTGPLIAALVAHTQTIPAAMPDPMEAVEDIDDDEIASRWVAIAATIAEPRLDDWIDERLADESTAASTIDGLLRTGTIWYHSALLESLSDDGLRFGAARLLARSEPDELFECLADIESPPAIVDILRAASFEGQRFDDVVEWRKHLDSELSDRQLSRLDGTLAVTAPKRYARLLFAGDVDDEWLTDDRAVADFITRHGASRWVAPLAVFRHVRDTDAFALTATFAVVSAYTEPFDDFDDEQLDPSNASTWLEQRPQLCSLPLALTEDEELSELLVETALHETLLRRNVQPPAMAGLPLSGHAPDTEQLDELLAGLDALSMDHPRDRVRLMRTLTDLVRRTRNGDIPRDVAAEIIVRFAHKNDATDLVARTFDNDDSVGHFDDWGCRGIEALMWRLETPTRGGIADVAGGWFTGPVERAPLYRAGFAALIDAVDASKTPG